MEFQSWKETILKKHNEKKKKAELIFEFIPKEMFEWYA